MNKNTNVLPISVIFNDKISLVRSLLELYSVLWKDMRPRTKDLLCICILEDMNTSDFKETVIKANIGYKNSYQINTEMTRLRKEGFIYKDSLRMDDHLHSNLIKIKEIVNSDKPTVVAIKFNKKGGNSKSK